MVKIPNYKKTLLRPDMKLEQGDGLLEMDRFKTFWKVYEIIEFNGVDWFGAEIVDSSKKFDIGGIVSCDRKAHCVHDNRFTVLTYYLPNYKILYGKKI